MEWIKISTDDILHSNFDDRALIILIKYQALYCQLESEPTDTQIRRIFSKKEIKFLQNSKEIVKELCETQIKNVIKKRNKDKIHYQLKQALNENSASGTKANRQLSAQADKIREDKNIKKKNKQKEKFSFSDVFDWISLFTYWEENKKGGRYKNAESRNRMLAKLQELTGNDFELAKKAICHCIDNNYQGFCNGNELYYRPDKVPKTHQIGDWDKTPETYKVGDY